MKKTDEVTKVKNAIYLKLLKDLKTNDSFENDYNESHIFIWSSGGYETRWLAKVNEYTIRKGIVSLTFNERSLISSQFDKHLVFNL